MIFKSILANIGDKLYNWGIERTLYDKLNDEFFVENRYSDAENLDFLDSIASQFESWKNEGISKNKSYALIKSGSYLSHSVAQYLIHSAYTCVAGSYSELIVDLEKDTRRDLDSIISSRNEDEFSFLTISSPEDELKHDESVYSESIEKSKLLKSYLTKNKIEF